GCRRDLEHRVLSNAAREDRRENPPHYRRLRTFVNDALGLPSTISPSVQRLHHLIYALQTYAALRQPPLQHVAALIQLMLIKVAGDTTVHVDINVQTFAEAEG